eukprot:6194308-Pleurochrysis_carterae.AAC.1
MRTTRRAGRRAAMCGTVRASRSEQPRRSRWRSQRAWRRTTSAMASRATSALRAAADCECRFYENCCS